MTFVHKSKPSIQRSLTPNWFWRLISTDCSWYILRLSVCLHFQRFSLRGNHQTLIHFFVLMGLSNSWVLSHSFPKLFTFKANVRTFLSKHVFFFILVRENIFYQTIATGPISLVCSLIIKEFEMFCNML